MHYYFYYVFISDLAIRKVETYLQTGKEKSSYGTLIYLAEGKTSKS